MSENDLRPTTYDVRNASSFTTVEQVKDENVRLGGGREGFDAVPEKLTDQIISMVPYTLDATAVSIMINALVPTAFANAPMTVSSEVTPAQKTAFMKAIGALGMKTVEGYDAMILTKEFAFDRKALLAIQKVFSGTRIIVLASEKQLSPADLDFLAQLPQASRPILLPADHLDEARKLLGMEAVGRDLHLKAMAGSSDSDAVMLKKQLGDDAILMTSKKLEMFLAAEGVNALVSAMQAQYQATARAA